MTESHPTDLALGWTVTPSDDPRYWVETSEPSPGAQGAGNLVLVAARDMATHTAIIAQSGAGKSFFLGRLVEELLLRTKARCLILDPNGDFRRATEVKDTALWTTAKYDVVARRGALPHESTKEEFEHSWATVDKAVFGGPQSSLRISWCDVSADALAEDIDPFVHAQIYHCHAFVAFLGYLIEEMSADQELSAHDDDIVALAEALWHTAEDSIARASSIAHRFPMPLGPQTMEGSVRLALDGWLHQRYGDRKNLPSATQATVRDALADMRRMVGYISPEIATYYFAKARQYREQGPFVGQWRSPNIGRARLRVIDMPSLGKKEPRLLAVSAILEREWKQAIGEWEGALQQDAKQDIRVPTFIVVDESHNLIPQEPRGRSEVVVREQFRTIVAEGRKFGLFLIVATQRPDKLDRMILSECENKAIMRIDSEMMLNLVKKALGLEYLPPRLLSRCLQFGLGRVLLAGRWSQEPQVLYTAARRTIEGGRNLQDEYWAAP